MRFENINKTLYCSEMLYCGSVSYRGIVFQNKVFAGAQNLRTFVRLSVVPLPCLKIKLPKAHHVFLRHVSAFLDRRLSFTKEM